ncbi:hypothetical protein D3C79_770120 [compost metagenome]
MQVQLARSVIQQVGAADDIGHPLPGVIQHHGQLISVQAIAAANDKVADLAAQMLFETALDPVIEMVGQLWHPYADGRVLAAVPGVAAQARVNAVIAFELLARAGAGVGQTLTEQAFDHFGIGLVALALVHHLAIPFQAVAFQGVEDRCLGAGGFAGRVDVFHAHQPGAADRTRVQP